MINTTIAREREDVFPVLLRSTIHMRGIDKKLVERVMLGKEKYGEALKTFNGRDALKDLEEEILDALFYSTQYKMELKRVEGEEISGSFYTEYVQATHILVQLKEVYESIQKLRKMRGEEVGHG